MNLEQVKKKFKPTKWSIRLFKKELNALQGNDQLRLLRNVSNALRKATDKETIEFLKAVEEATFKNLNTGGVTWSFVDERVIIETMIALKEQGLLNNTPNEIVRLLKRHFRVTMSKHSILDIMKPSKKLKRYKISVRNSVENQ